MTTHQPTTGGAVHTGSAGQPLTVRVLAAGVVLTPAAAVIFLVIHVIIWKVR